MNSLADDQRETIAFLSEATSYDVPDGSVRRIETHWSVIFLIADRAYKLKRQLAFSLLDYTTVEKRERACRAELGVNAGTAPDLYLGLRKITRRADGTLAFDGDGPTVDWVVVMRRFDQNDLLDHLADARHLDACLMRGLADEIASLHARAVITAQWGGAGAIRAALARWRDEQSAVDGVFEAGRSEAYFREAALALSDAAELLERRRETGKVRRCHGDLRLANICLLDGRPTLFDAIEFSDELGCIDVLYDLAFLLTDLCQHGLPDLGNIVFNRYLDVTGDSDGLRVLPLFLSLRAAMRAQMLASSAMRRSGPAAAKLLATALSQLALATALLRRGQPRLIAIGGLDSTAKSQLAASLAADLGPAPGARIIRGHVVRQHVVNAALESRLPPAAYDAAVTERVYDALSQEARTILAAGISAVVEMDFLCSNGRRKIADAAQAASVPFTGFWLSEGEGEDGLVPLTDGTANGAAKQGRSAHRDWHSIDLARGPAYVLETARSLTESTKGCAPARP